MFNLVTVVLPEEVKDDLCNQSAIGFKFFAVFVKKRVQTGKENLWSESELEPEGTTLYNRKIQNMLITIYKCLSHDNFSKYLKDMFTLRQSEYSFR